MNNLLFTGASGFLGKNILPVLKKEYNVSTVGLTDEDDYKVNVASDIPLLKQHYDVILHAAGKAHVVPKTDTDKQAFFDVNLQGTKNLCKALEKSGVPANFIFISTVAVYGCDYGRDIDETFPLKGESPYAMSKRLAEEFLECWCNEHKVCLTILRPSLIAGPNPPGNLGAMINGIRNDRYLSITGGRAKKSILMVQDIPVLISLVLDKGGIYNVCDDYNPSFGELELKISQQLHKKRPYNIPYWMARTLALGGDLFGKKAPINTRKLEKITESLTFSNKKARKELGWKPTDVLGNFKIE